MRPSIRSYGAVPLVSLLVTGTLETVAMVAGAVVIVISLLITALIMRDGVAPWLAWGPFKAGFTRVEKPDDQPQLHDEPRAPPSDGPTTKQAVDPPERAAGGS